MMVIGEESGEKEVGCLRGRGTNKENRFSQGQIWEKGEAKEMKKEEIF